MSQGQEYDLYFPKGSSDGVDAADHERGVVAVAKDKYVTLPCKHLERVTTIRPGRNSCQCDRQYIAVPRESASKEG